MDILFCKLFFRDKIRRKSGLIPVLAAFLLVTNMGNAATYYSRASTAFNTASTWSVNPSGTPTNGTAITNADIFIIQSGNNVTVGAARTIAQVTVNSGGTLTLGTFVLTVSGSWTNNGTITGSTGRITASTGTLTNNGVINFTGAGGIVKTTGTLTNSATGTITIVGAGTVTMGTGDFVNNNSSAGVNFGSSAVTVTGTDASQNIGGFVTTGRFTCSKTSGTLTVNGDINCAGITKSGTGTGILNLGTDNVINCSSTVILTAGTLNGGTNTTLNVSLVSTTAWQGTGTVFNPGTGTVNFNAAGNQTLSATGTKTFYNLSFSNSGTKTNATTTVTNIYTLSGSAVASAVPTYGAGASLRYSATTRTAGAEWLATFAATGGVVIDNASTVTANGNKVFNTSVPLTINSGGTLTTGANDFTFNGDFINNGTWTPSTGDVTIAGAVSQDIGGFTTTGVISMTKTNGTAILQGNVNGGSFTMSGPGGVLSLGAGLTHTFTGTWTNTNGTLQCNTGTLNIDGAISGSAITFTANNGTVHFRGASPQTIPAFTFNDVQFSGAGLKTLSGTTTVNGILTINSASELNLGSVVLTLTANGTPLVNQGVFTASTSTVNYTGSTGLTNITVADYYNLDGTGGNRKLLSSGPIGIAGIFTPGAGTYDVTGSEVDFNGAGNQDIPAFVFNKLTMSTSGVKKIPAAVIVTCTAIGVTEDASIEINADGGGKLNVVQ